eukprot:gene35120-45465_t
MRVDVPSRCWSICLQEAIAVACYLSSTRIPKLSWPSPWQLTNGAVAAPFLVSTAAVLARRSLPFCQELQALANGTKRIRWDGGARSSVLKRLWHTFFRFNHGPSSSAFKPLYSLDVPQQMEVPSYIRAAAESNKGRDNRQGANGVLEAKTHVGQGANGVLEGSSGNDGK